MISKSIIMIVPRLPPAIDGVGDYALALAKSLRASSQCIETIFIVGDPNWKESENATGFRCLKVFERSEKSLVECLGLVANETTTVLLHYVGYGYARRGSPMWLLQGLQKAKELQKFKIATMFHELYAFGPPWTSQFWTSPLQRLIFQRLVKLSTNSLSSLAQYAEKIQSYQDPRSNPVVSIPVFSNVGEMEQLKLLPERERTLIVFGGRGPRERAYFGSGHLLKEACRLFQISKIIDIGSTLSHYPEIEGVFIEPKGVLDASEVSLHLSQAFMGFVNYPEIYLAKSGILSAYCAHGVVPLIAGQGQHSKELTPSKHYIDVTRLKPHYSETELQEIARAAFNWYQTHNLTKTTASFIKVID